ncbi:hypothetical protein [Streptomyces sp. NRRL F-5630]|uniref:hypothetical protein n=1 Tax=Streptomyces sp. NRRL F-5630 TaxID=1463864 RepID=UPI003D72343C
MPEHKMIVMGGIRVRAEDADRYRARPRAQAGPLTAAQANPAPPAPDAFDPGAHDVPGVLAHLADADAAETARVLDVEAGGKARKSLTDRRDELLAAAQERAGDGA